MKLKNRYRNLIYLLAAAAWVLIAAGCDFFTITEEQLAGVDEELGRITAVTPPDGCLVANSSPLLAWEDLSPANGYRIQFSDYRGFIDDLNLADERLTENSFQPEFDLEREITYCWRIRMYNVEGQFGSWSDTWSLTPVAVIRVDEDDRPGNPAEQASDDSTPLLEWLEIRQVQEYHLQLIGPGGDFTGELLVDEPGLTEPGCQVILPLAPGEYSWRVRLKNAAGQWEEWGDENNLLISIAIPVPDQPGDGEIITGPTPLFSWDEYNSEYRYQLQVSVENDFSGTPIINLEDLAESEYQSADPLDPGIYYWRIRAANTEHFFSGWSPVWEFTVAGG